MSDFRSGFVAIIGRPNVGKSTLVNAFLGQKIAPVSPRPQTTRRRQLGILTTETYQMVFVDTPGIHQPRHKLGEFLNQEAKEALDGVDVMLFLVDASEPPTEEDRQIAALLSPLSIQTPLVLAANKIDRVPTEALTERLEAYQALVPAGTAVIPLSATRGDGRQELLDVLLQHLPIRPPEFDEEQITDMYERDIAAELIREAALLHLRDEVPHGIAIRIDEFKERENGAAYIAATLFVERESHKGIVIGEGGKMLKQIGTTARQEIEAMSGRKVFLELRVKVLKGWRDNAEWLRRLGYRIKDKRR